MAASNTPQMIRSAALLNGDDVEEEEISVEYCKIIFERADPDLSLLSTGDMRTGKSFLPHILSTYFKRLAQHLLDIASFVEGESINKSATFPIDVAKVPEFRRIAETKEIGTNTEPILKAKEMKEIGTNTDAMLFVPAKLPRAPYTSSDDSSEENEREKAPPATAKILSSPSQKLFNSLHKLCQDRSIEHTIIIKSSKNPNHFLMIGPNVSSIKSEINCIASEFSQEEEFKVIVEDKANPVRRSTPSLVVSKQNSRGDNGVWNETRRAKCEFLVKGTEEDKCPHNRHIYGAVYAVVPAHFVLTAAQTGFANEAFHVYGNHLFENQEIVQVDSNDCDHHPSVMAFYHLQDGQQNRRAKEVVYDIEREDEDRREIAVARKGCESTTSNQRYSALETGDLEMIQQPVDLNHPMLICFRQIIRSSSIAMPQHCPIRKCCLDQNASCCHMFMNDLALIPMNYEDATRLQEALEAEENAVFGKERRIETIEELEELHEQEQAIRVGDAEGKLVRAEVLTQNGDTFAKRVTFNLLSGTLEDGDCGSIVHIRRPNSNKWQPLAMFVSKMELETTADGFPELIYEAVLLYQAFRDMEQEYPHRISNIKRFNFQ